MASEAAMRPAVSSGLATLAADTAAAALPVSLYVHVPFCVSKCAYCDFHSVPGHESWRQPFVDAALFEVGHWSHHDLLDDVPTVYVGGGTPTLLGDGLVRLVRGLRETARIRPQAEFTVETNPETTDAILVAALIDGGVNRFSLGVQSFDDEILRILGRCHDAEAASGAARTLRDAGAAFSIDLICGVPGQSFESWDDTLEKAVASGARHVSVYPLTVEDGTPLAVAVESGSMPALDPDVAADMMLAADVALAAAGMPRYEVASYAQPGHEARHNQVYWSGGAYLGIGPSAASMLPHDTYVRLADGEGWPLPEQDGGQPPLARTRFSHSSDLPAYLRRPLTAPTELEHLSEAEVKREDVMLGLRLRRGVLAASVEAAGLTAVLGGLADKGLVSLSERDGDARWRTTEQGWLLGNEVFGSVWAGE